MLCKTRQRVTIYAYRSIDDFHSKKVTSTSVFLKEREILNVTIVKYIQGGILVMFHGKDFLYFSDFYLPMAEQNLREIAAILNLEFLQFSVEEQDANSIKTFPVDVAGWKLIKAQVPSFGGTEDL